MKYDKKKHFDLVKYKNKFKLDGKDLSDISEENFCELRIYLAIQIEYIEWSSREHYFELIEKFLTEPMDCLTLAKKSRAINDEAERLESEFILFEPDLRSKGFSSYVNKITDVHFRANKASLCLPE